nr:hypothetical protein CFP56_62882 [Quercus suber]
MYPDLVIPGVLYVMYSLANPSLEQSLSGAALFTMTLTLSLAHDWWGLHVPSDTDDGDPTILSTRSRHSVSDPMEVRIHCDVATDLRLDLYNSLAQATCSSTDIATR